MKAPHFLSIATVLLLLTSGTALASSFKDYVDRLGNHPRIMSIIAKSLSSQSQAEGELGLPDPVFSIGVDNVPVSDPAFDRFLPTSKIIAFNQKIPNPILLRAKSSKLKQLSEKQNLMADYMHERLKFMLVTKLAKYKSVKAQQKLIKKQLTLYKELEETFEGQIRSGRSVYQRFSEVDVERAEVERKLNNLEASLVSIKAEFISLVEEIPEIDVPDMLDEHWGKNSNNLYPVLIAAQNIDIAKKDVDIADAAFLPNFGLNAIYKQRENGQNASFSGEDWFSIQAQITIPLWASKNQKPKLKAAIEKRNSAQFSYDDTGRIWVQKMTSIKAMRDALERNIKVLEDKKLAMDGKIKAVQRNYEAGTEDLDRVLLTKIDQLNIQVQLAKVEASYVSKVAEFNSNIVGNSINISKEK